MYLNTSVNHISLLNRKSIFIVKVEEEGFAKGICFNVISDSNTNAKIYAQPITPMHDIPYTCDIEAFF